MRKFTLLLVPVSLLFLASCKTDAAMWGACSNAPGVDPTGTDKTYVLVCRNGTWEPVMTAGEFVRIRQGEQVTIAPLPTRPTPTTTSNTTSTTAGSPTSTTSTSSTSTTTTSTTTTTFPPAPSIVGVNPSTGPTAGGTSVIITGTNFGSTTLVTFGGQPASFIVDSGTQITAVTPANAAGAEDVVVTTASASVTSFNAFTYV